MEKYDVNVIPPDDKKTLGERLKSQNRSGQTYHIKRKQSQSKPHGNKFFTAHNSCTAAIPCQPDAACLPVFTMDTVFTSVSSPPACKPPQPPPCPDPCLNQAWPPMFTKPLPKKKVKHQSETRGDKETNNSAITQTAADCQAVATMTCGREDQIREVLKVCLVVAVYIMAFLVLYGLAYCLIMGRLYIILSILFLAYIRVFNIGPDIFCFDCCGC